jgi:methionyl aminopeptidase
MKKIARNDDCWCGSGKKYKKCHLPTDDALVKKLKTYEKDGFVVPTLDLIKTPTEIEGIRQSSRLATKILNDLHGKIVPGITTQEINDYVHNEIIKNNAIPAPLNYRGFPKSICTSINNVICHGIPGETKLKDGDIINIDVTTILNGFFGDTSQMFLVGKVSEKAKKLVQVTKECLDLGIKEVKPFEPFNNIGRAIEKHARQNGFSVVKDYGGHGIGIEFHEDPFVYHFSRKEKGFLMVPGMVFTIEPMINEGTYELKILADKWTAITKDGKLSAQWEHTVLVTETGVEVLTA